MITVGPDTFFSRKVEFDKALEQIIELINTGMWSEDNIRSILSGLAKTYFDAGFHHPIHRKCGASEKDKNRPYYFGYDMKPYHGGFSTQTSGG